MSKKLYEESSIQAIANAIRAKNGSTDTYKISEMAGAIESLNVGGAENLIEFSQVRPEVQNFLDNVTYNSSDYTTSQIENYVTNTTNNQPVGCTINLKSAGTLIVYDGASGGSLVTNSISGENVIYNLTPNSISHYVNIVNGKIE